MLIAFVNITESVNDLEEKVKDLQRELESLRLRKQPFYHKKHNTRPRQGLLHECIPQIQIDCSIHVFFLKKKDNVSSC